MRKIFISISFLVILSLLAPVWLAAQDETKDPFALPEVTVVSPAVTVEPDALPEVTVAPPEVTVEPLEKPINKAPLAEKKKPEKAKVKKIQTTQKNKKSSAVVTPSKNKNQGQIKSVNKSSEWNRKKKTDEKKLPAQNFGQEYTADYVEPGADSFNGTLADAVVLLGLSADQKQRLVKKVIADDFTKGFLRRGDEVKAMVFGNKKIKRDFTCRFRRVEKIPVEVFDLGDIVIIKPLICWNWAILSTRQPAQAKSSPSETYTAGQFPPEAGDTECKSCNNFVEANVYAQGSIQGSSNGTKHGFSGSSDVMHWWNKANVFGDQGQDCSKWQLGLGFFGAANTYETGDISGGEGYKVGIQEGVRFYDKDPIRQEFVAKFRQGFQYTNWESQNGDYRRQWNLGAGAYSHYYREIAPKLDIFAKAGAWVGFNEDVEASEGFTKPLDLTFIDAAVGLRYYINKKWSAEAQAGFNFEGWSGEIPFVPSIETSYNTDNYGKFTLGLKAKFYAALNPAWIVYGEWNFNKPYKANCVKTRQDQIKPAGRGIGGNGGTELKNLEPVSQSDSIAKVEIQKPTTSDPISANIDNTHRGDAGSKVKAVSPSTVKMVTLQIGDHAGDATNLFGR